MITNQKIPSIMHSLVLENVGDLRLEERPVPTIKENEVLLKIYDCGICSSDIERIFVTGTYHFPTIPGHEFCGEIVGVMEENKDLLGKKACVFPLLPCKKCPACLEEEYAQCSNYNYFGSRCDGAYSEYLAVPIWNLVFFDNLDYRVAALCEPTAVAIHAINRVKMDKNSKVLVIGCGTIGLLIALFAKSQGLDVYISINNEEKRELVESFSITPIDANNIEVEKERHTNNCGFDYVFEATGNNDAIEQAIISGGNFAKIIVVGNPKKDLSIEKNIYWKILRKQMSLIGTWNSSYGNEVNDWKTAIKYMQNNQEQFKKLITHIYKLSDYEEALNVLKDRTKLKIKVMFEVNNQNEKR